MDKKENLVVYKNELNTVPLRAFNPKEMDLLFSICSEMRDKQLETVMFTFEELRNLSNYKMTATVHFSKDLDNVYEKLLSLNFVFEDETSIERFVLFTRYKIDKVKQNVEISVNKQFAFLLNDISSNFTKFELEEFTDLKSSYSKTAYRLLKQFRKTGYVIYTIEDFKRLFTVPKVYKMGHIDQKILNVVKEELMPIFKTLEINKISKGKGRKITHIEFIFTAETDFKKNDKKTFRDKDGFYYEKTFDELTEDEIQKEYPNAPQPQADKYYK